MPSLLSFGRSSNGRGPRLGARSSQLQAGETVQHLALDMNRGATDSGEYVSAAHTLAGQQQLDFLELVDSRRTILSSAQWQAKFGYPEAAIPQAAAAAAGAFLKRGRTAGWRNPRPVAVRTAASENNLCT